MLNNARRTYWATVLFLLAPLVLVPWVAAAQKQTTGKTWQAKRDRKLGHTGSGSHNAGTAERAGTRGHIHLIWKPTAVWQTSATVS